MEVRVLAKCNHANILKYFNSWLEIVYEKNYKESEDDFEMIVNDI